MKLRISDDLVLAADFVTSTQAILAKKRVGKTYTAQVLAEEMLAAKQQVVVIDLTSAWWGLRSSADGRTAGYPITIFGGRHGDLPLEATAGEALARAVVEDRFSAVFDVRLLKKGQRLRFIADFLETLYDQNTEAMHLFMDEADAYIPQQTFSPEQARALGAADELVRRGGIGGIGVTLISQRAQTLNKNVLSQVDMLTVLRMNHPKDIGAIKDWIVEHVDAATAKEMTASLPALPKGEAWVWAPEHEIFKRISVRPKRTFDSGRTPKAGERLAPPKVLAKVDLERLGATIAASVQRAKDNDPSELKKQVTALRKELDRVGRGQDRAEANEKENHSENIELRSRVSVLDKELAAAKKIKNVEVIKPADLRRLEDLVKKIDKLVLHITGNNADLETHLSGLRAEATKLQVVANHVTQLRDKKTPDAIVGAPSGQLSAARTAQATIPSWAELPKTRGQAASAWKNGTASTNGASLPDGLAPAHLRLLSAISWWESIGVPTPDLGGVAFVAGTTTSSSAFNNNRSRLRAAGYIDYPSNGNVQLTEAGRTLAPPPTLPPTNEALQEAILQKVTPAHGRMLRVLIEAYPNEIPLEELAQRAGTSITSSAFNNNRSWLHARGLAAYPRKGFVRATGLLFSGGLVVSDQHKDQAKDKGTAVLSLPNAPSERMKACARLMQAAFLFSMASLQQGARGFAALADVNDLAFRRNEGKVDLSTALLGDLTTEGAHELLLKAAIAFADADANEFAEAEAAEKVANAALSAQERTEE